MKSDAEIAEQARLNRRLVAIAKDHGAHAEIREEGDVAVFCDCTVPDGEGRRLACEIEVVRSMDDLRRVLGY